MPTRPRQDNVIYANFGARSAATKNPTHEVRRSTTYPPAAQWLIDALAPVDSQRYQRGRDYARTGHVLSLELEHGRIAAQVAGSHNEPFSVVISLPWRGPDDLTAVPRALAATSGSLDRARNGQLDPVVLEALVGEGITFRCDCPDHSEICKHAVAVAEVAAQRIAERPTMLFELRGLDMGSVERQMIEQARQVGEESARATDDRFWQGAALPELPNPSASPALEDSDLNLLHKAMRTVSYTAVEQLRAVADIEDMYDYLLRR
ncbi:MULTISPECIES: hypothetical protein [unclassified Corynebacterium]|uniref:hypothetical protein n=1 Tax=unclassified Corynebacterium TaxID=2624378 RepID=UPI0029CA0497|nr:MULTISPECIES: hypothetical protein [unclassified Corynebacterium]WPF66992.1 hypothetical protein OLX12_04520 [Corynebacterium sp. 22KM0430]WPF69480.1 hypothetical protein OLW90_04515 [Corynebacterium sp. 21KM1197]